VGEGHDSEFLFSFNGSLRFEGRPDRLTGDAGVVLLRELDERLGFTSNLADELTDTRHQDLITHPLDELLRSRLYAMIAGWRDQDDLDHLRHDGAMRIAVSNRRGDAALRPVAEDALVPDGLASQPTQSRLVEMLSLGDNPGVLHRELLGQAVDRHRRRFAADPAATVTIDIDSTAIAAHGSQVGVQWSGHYHRRCFHPLVAMLAETEDWLDVALRPGSCHTALGTKEFLIAIVNCLKHDLGRVDAVRGDAGYRGADILSFLEDEAEVPYVFRFPTNARLDKLAAPFMKRPPGRPPREGRVWLQELSYRAGSWKKDRRLVLVVLEKPGELFLKKFFLVTSWSEKEKSAEDLLEFYRQRGTLEGQIGVLKDVLRPVLSSTSRLKSHVRGKAPKKRRLTPRDDYACNEVSLLLFAMAHNLANVGREILASAMGRPCSARRFRRSILRTAARLICHARRVVIVLRDAVSPRWQIFLRTLDAILPLAPPTTA